MSFSTWCILSKFQADNSPNANPCKAPWLFNFVFSRSLPIPGSVPKAYRSLYRPIQATSSIPTGGEAGAIEEQLLRPLQALSLKLYFESDLGATWPAPSNRVAADGASRRMAVVRRVAELVRRIGRRKFSNNVQDVARQRDAWKQVLKFLFLLQAIGPGSMIYGVTAGGRSAFTRNFQCHQEVGQDAGEWNRCRGTVVAGQFCAVVIYERDAVSQQGTLRNGNWGMNHFNLWEILCLCIETLILSDKWLWYEIKVVFSWSAYRWNLIKSNVG